MKRVLYWPKDIEISNAATGYVVGWQIQNEEKQMTICSCIVTEKSEQACNPNDLERQINAVLSNIQLPPTCENSLFCEPPCILARWYRCRSDALIEKERREEKASYDAATCCALPIIASKWWFDNGSSDSDGSATTKHAEGILVLYTSMSAKDNNMEHYASSASPSVELKTVISRINSAGDYTDVLMSGLLNSKSTGVFASKLHSTISNEHSVPQQQQEFMNNINGGDEQTSCSIILESLAQKSFLVSHVMRNSTPIPRLLQFRRRIYSEKERKCSKLTPRNLASERHLEVYSDLVHSLFDAMIGVIFSCALLRLFLDSTRYTLFDLWQAKAGNVLKDYTAWLDRFPLGFKLNVPLTRNMNRESLRVIVAQDEIAHFFLPPLVQKCILSGLAVIAISLGGSSLIAAVIDIYRIATLQVRLLGNIFRALWAGQYGLFSSLWKLFRGKKKNILRHRTDTMEYDFMQLLLGVLMFTIVTFLFTTILVYFGFFGLVHLTSLCGLIILYGGYSFIHHMPLIQLVSRLTNRKRFPYTVKFETVKVLNDDHLIDKKIDVFEMVSIPDRATHFAIKAYATSFKKTVSCIGIFFSELISGKRSSAEVKLLFSST